VSALKGIKILELGQLIAGPFAAKTLGDFGAEVIKVETPVTGDALRKWRLLKDGTSVWWQVQSRNKQSISLDLKQAAAQKIIRALLQECDVLIENFRPGTLEEWNLDPQDLLKINPRLIVLRISGYGQTGPYRNRPGFGVVAEAMGGLRHLTAEPGRVPVRVGVSIGDTLAALHGVIGVLLALHDRNCSGQGQIIDVALYEAVFNCMESLLPEYSAFGEVRQAAGSALPGIAPSNAYPCKDGAYVLIAGNGDSIFKRLMIAIGQGEMAQNPDYADNTGRVKHIAHIDQAIENWTLQHSVQDVLNVLEHAKVPAGKIYTAQDIANDEHFLARDMLLNAPQEDGTRMLVPGIVPKLSRTPGAIVSSAPKIGENNEAVLRSIGITDEQIQAMYQQGLIWSEFN
jgi:formyl-CoA transferase